MGTCVNPVTYEEAVREFRYYPVTGHLYRRKSSLLYCGWNLLNTGRRMQVWLRGYNIKATRLIWLLMTGEWPDKVIDHIDRNPANDRWKNLRHVTQAVNVLNSDRRENFHLKPCGYYGVRRRGRQFRIQVWVGGRNNTYDLPTAEQAAWMFDILQVRDKGPDYPSINHPEWLDCFSEEDRYEEFRGE